jgi:hypothetical protein
VGLQDLGAAACLAASLIESMGYEVLYVDV